MALALKDRVKETTIVVGTGTATLLGSSIGFQPFSVVGNGNTTYYCISDQFGSNWEVGIGTYTTSGNTLSRTTVLSSSNAGALVVFTAGIKDVFVTYPSEKGVWYDASGNVLLTGTTTATNLAYTGTLTGSTGILNIGSGQVYKDASGNVGIGTSSPVTYGKLVVKQTADTSISSLALAAQASTTDSQLGIGYDSDSGTFRLTSSYLTTGSYKPLSFWTSDTERMRINSSGNVGIGTTAPSTKLTVAGSITITGAFALRGSYGGGAITSNFAAGDGALASNTTGASNTASGMQALFNNTTGNYNTASGQNALYSNTTGTQNTASGFNALNNNTTGSNNTASGMQALLSNTIGTQNTASGMQALLSNTTGNYNTASGQAALRSNTTGSQNTASGMQALMYNTTGSNNTASGQNALVYNTTGSNNTAGGMQALLSNTTGASNTASGQNALFSNTTGNYNTASGQNALLSNTTGSGNSAFNPLNSAGTYAPVFNPTTENNRFCMGSTGVTNAYIQVAWTVVSDARDKTNFAPVPHGLDFVNQLQPTAYQFKEDRETDVATGIVRYGFKAQDILALEGDTPVIIDTEDLDKLRFNSDSLIPVLVNAIKELTARLELLEGK